MRTLALLVVLVGCALTDPIDTVPPDELPPEAFEEPRKPMYRGGRRGEHPVVLIRGAVADGEHTYTTRGTTSNRTVKTDARLYRVGYIGPAGFMIDWMDSSTYGGGSSTNTLDFYGFLNRPVWPNRRLRFNFRPGAYYKRTNIKNGLVSDVEPRTWGFRFEGEAEVDVIKAERFVFSVFGNGRVGWGWGYAHAGGTTENVTEFGWGWEAGLRATLHNWYAAVSWIEREDEIAGNFRFVDAVYGFEGANISFGFRF